MKVRQTMKKAGRGLAALALATGVAAGTTGCETTEGSLALGTLFGMSNDPATRAIGAMTTEVGRHQSRMDAARAGRSQINIYTDGNPGYRNQRNDYVSGDIHKVWTEHNVYKDGQKGMKIHTKFDIRNNMGNQTEVAAYFHYKDGRKLRDKDGKYSTPNGQVGVGKTVFPSYENSSYGDFVLFIPYDQIIEVPYSGRVELKFDVWLWDYSGKHPRKLDESNWEYMWLKD